MKKSRYRESTIEFVMPSPAATRKLGREIAVKILNWNANYQRALIIGLSGELGSGKTTFLQGFGRGLGIKEKILSPTFILIKKFTIKGSRFINFYHIDCYRLRDADELSRLDWKRIISNPKNIVVAEWADIVKKAMPTHTLWIKFEHINAQKRKIILNGGWAETVLS